MTKENAMDIIEKANRELDEATEPPMSVEEFVAELLDNPKIGRTAHRYLLDAIEYYGTRTVFEKGEEKERYEFFDDPANEGEHAVLGNTDVLNNFVDDLRTIANSDERMQKIILFNGPTATGKSELKRCMINGLRAYSKTDDGKRYTCDWNISSLNTSYEGTSGMSYGEDSSQVDETQWFQSPVNVNPVAVLPNNVRRDLSDYNVGDNMTDVGLDPFSQEVYDILKKSYENNSDGKLFSSITDKRHFRVRRYSIEETQGIGILTAEDDGSVKERLLGSWMPSMLQELNSKGRKDPRAFSYDGVLSQGNGGVTVVEDAAKHADVLIHLLNIPDEGYAKIDKRIGFDVDTVPIFISNPDLVDQQLKDVGANQKVPLEKVHGVDPLKAIKRRLFQYPVKYLTSLRDEVELLRKEINGHTKTIQNGSFNIRDEVYINETEFAPHSIEAVALYNVITRLTDDNLPDGLTLVEKALLFDRGYIETISGRKDIEDFDLEDTEDDGKFGIPVTYTRDVLRALTYSDDEDIFLPEDLLNEVSTGLSEAPVFADFEEETFMERLEPVKDYIDSLQQDDVIESILADRKASMSAVKEYVDNLYAWDEDDEENYDKLLMKDFEIKHLGMSDSDYRGSTPIQKVIDFRNDRIITPLNRYHWNQRTDSFEVDELDLREAPVLAGLLGDYSWEDVFMMHENLNPVDWSSPPDDTPTAQVKQKCIDNMINNLGYSEESAKRTSERVFKRNKDMLIDVKDSIVD